MPEFVNPKWANSEKTKLKSSTRLAARLVRQTKTGSFERIEPRKLMNKWRLMSKNIESIEISYIHFSSSGGENHLGIFEIIYVYI